MQIDPIHQVLEPHVVGNNYDKILDIGGWFIPYERATHVVDLMPWETRGCRVNVQQLPGEQFSRETWVTVDICDPQMRLPFPDKFFDFVICGGTLEDLPNPAPCIREIRRVGKAGYIRVPTMTCELTVGIEDRENSVIGYCHHNWICKSAGPSQLTMMRKSDAQLANAIGCHIPLITFERDHRNQPLNSLHLLWENDFEADFLQGAAVASEVHQHIKSLKIPLIDHLHDAAVRLARRTRSRLRNGKVFENSKAVWWEEMLRISKPYSDPHLHRKAGGQ